MDTTTNLEDLATAFEAAPLNSISHPLCRGCLTLIAEGKIELFADNIFPLTKVKKAFEALSGRRTIGEVDLNSVIKDGSHYVSKRSPMNLHVVSAEAEFEAEKPCGLPQLPVIRNVLPLLLLTWTSLVVSNAAQAGPNHLSGQVAPYLSRAISQPVDWYPSGTDAFKRARELNRPVLLDMGAVWCGWCDLMDRERYKRPDLAAFINANFVTVKVDYEASHN